MTTPLPIFRLLITAFGAGLLLLGAPAPSQAQKVVVMVNGEPITDFDIEQRTKLDALIMHKSSSRQAVIDELIDDKVKIKEGKKYSLDLGACSERQARQPGAQCREGEVSKIDQQYASTAARMHMAPEQLTKVLEVKGIRPETFKSRLMAEVVWNQLVLGRYAERLRVSEKEVAAAVGEKPKIEGVEYKTQQVILIVPQGSPPASVQARHKEAEAYRSRVQSCDEANSLFRSTPNATIRESVTKTTADVPEVYRKLLDSTPIGHLTPPEVTKQGIEMFVLCSRNPTMIDTPKMTEEMNKRKVKKYEEVSNNYLQEVRKAAMIEYR